MAKPKHDQLHFRVDPKLHEEFYFWCRRRGRTMTEICLLAIRSLLNEEIDLAELARLERLRQVDETRQGETNNGIPIQTRD